LEFRFFIIIDISNLLIISNSNAIKWGKGREGIEREREREKEMIHILSNSSESML